MRLVTADWDHRAFVAQHYFCDPRRDNTDAILARIVSLDDGDVGVANVVFELRAHVLELLAALLQECRHRHPRNARRRPQENLRGTVVADHLRLHVRGIHAKMLSEMDAKTQAVEECACTEHAIVARRIARNIGERIGWIRYRPGLLSGAARTICGTMSR